MKTYLLIPALAALLMSSLAFSSHTSTKFDTDELLQFEKTNRCSGCDLSGATLGNHSRAQLDHANLSNINLFYSGDQLLNLSAADLRNANLSHANLSDADLSMADLTGASLDGAFLYRTNLYGA
ncbi:MAG TPA: pentapeptide repeat-containing protein, partial [Gammaproteobacteria bacterium]|nr:pentapeptide repeat-containing protein [Gammaproteobacteria bacterium]